MPLELSHGDRRLLYIAGGVLLLLISGSLILTGAASDTSESPTTYSAGSQGAKAAYRLLESSGYQVERWEHPLPELSDPVHTTFVLAEPEGFASSKDQAALREFIERGGRVIATGSLGAFFLPEHFAVPDPIEGMIWKRVASRSPSSITRAAPEITLAPRAYWTEPHAMPLYADAGKVSVVKYRLGAGDVMWWASATPLTNAGLREPGNLEFFLACVGGAGRRRILWDEYFHGHRRSSPASATLVPLRWTFFQLVALTLALLFTFSRRSGPVVPLATERRLSPLEFVRTLGSLYERAGATSVAVDISYQRFRYWLIRRLRMAGNASIDQLEHATRELMRDLDPAFAATLRACESAREDSGLTARTALKLTRSLHEYADRLELFGMSRKESR